MSVFARVAFVALVLASFAAFFVAQRLKSAPPVATLRGVTRYFSPNGDGHRDVAKFKVKVRKADDISVSIVDEAGSTIRRIADGVAVGARDPLPLEWDGRDEDGVRVTDGRYLVRVSLRHGGRAVTLEPGLTVDLRAPRPTVLVGGPDGSRWITGPGGNVPFHVLVVSRSRPTRVQVLRTDTSSPAVVARQTLAPGERDGVWDGMAGGAPAPPGTYQVVASVRDHAGNVGRSAPPADQAASAPVRGKPGVSVRRLVARPPADPVRAGRNATFAVDSRGRPFRWNVRRVGEAKPRKRGKAKTGGELKVKAPYGGSGLYVLNVTAGRDHTAVPFAVQGGKSAPILVVVPALTWFAEDGLDDNRDGLPDLLARGEPVVYPKLMGNGLPDGFTDDTAALLAFLDAQKIHYDITTDLTLAANRAGLSDEREGVLLAGPLRWIPTELGRRFRRYAAGGGRIAVFGADTLRRGVGVGSDRLVRPLPPAPLDPFGTRVRPLRDLTGSEELVPVADEGATGLLTGVDTLPGFTRVEESGLSDRVDAALAPVDSGALDEAAAGDNPPPEALPVLALTRVGDGEVIRVGLPEWGARLQAHAVPVQQLTRNIADILRGATPRIRSF